jgi:hypothetical protein
MTREENEARIQALCRHDLEVEAMEAFDLLNHPEVMDFLDGTRREVAHQIQRWGTVGDRAKEPQDWFWLVGYLAGKALKAHIDGDENKAMHHTISSAAALANWHTHIKLGAGLMTPGSSDLQRMLEDTFGLANTSEAVR